MFGNKDYNLLKEKYETTANELTAANLSIKSLSEQVEDYKSTVERSAIAQEELKLKLDTTEKSVNSKVNAVLASIGVKNFAIETISIQPSMSPKEALVKFNALSGNEKTEFYRKHKDLITQGLNAKN